MENKILILSLICVCSLSAINSPLILTHVHIVFKETDTQISDNIYHKVSKIYKK